MKQICKEFKVSMNSTLYLKAPSVRHPVTPVCNNVSTRLHCFQRCGFWRDVSCKHGNGRRLRRLHLRVPGQLQFLRGDVEAGGTDLLAGEPVQSRGRTRHPTEGIVRFYHGGETLMLIYLHILDCWLVFTGLLRDTFNRQHGRHWIHISCCRN